MIGTTPSSLSLDMATITFSDAAPEVTDPVRFSFANQDPFDLASGGSYDTENVDIIGGALAHPWLKVEQAEPAPEELAQPNPNDPHQNPAADHLNTLASPEVVSAAQERNAAIQAGEAVPATTEPVVAPAVVPASAGVVPADPQPVPTASPTPTQEEAS